MEEAVFLHVGVQSVIAIHFLRNMDGSFAWPARNSSRGSILSAERHRLKENNGINRLEKCGNIFCYSAYMARDSLVGGGVGCLLLYL